MDFATLKARLRTSVQSPSILELTDVDAGAYINSGYLDVASRYPYHQTRKRCTFDTTIGEEKYQLPGDIAAVLRVKNSTMGYKIFKGGDRLIADRLTDNYRGDPKRYVRYRNYIELVPTPGSVQTIEIFYLAIPAVLALEADVPVVPLTWHDGIRMRAKWYYYLDKEDLAQQAAIDASYKLWLSDKPSEIDEESRDIDSGVELPELTREWIPRSSRYDDGTFDYRD